MGVGCHGTRSVYGYAPREGDPYTLVIQISLLHYTPKVLSAGRAVLLCLGAGKVFVVCDYYSLLSFLRL